MYRPKFYKKRWSLIYINLGSYSVLRWERNLVKINKMVRKYFRNSIFLRKTYLTFVAVKSQNAVRIRFFVELFHLLGTIGQQIFSYRKVIPCRAIQEKTHTFPFTLFTPAGRHDYHQKVALYLKFSFISKYQNKTRFGKNSKCYF